MADPAAHDVAIVGGGYAGMAAAVALAERDIRVTVYEAAHDLGGRARRVLRGGRTVDNGQHILIGAYRETMRMIERVGAGTASVLRLPLRWSFPPNFDLRTFDLPPPWHIALGLLGSRGMTLRARVRCARFFDWCRRRHFRLAADTSVSALLGEHGQHADAIRFLWQPLCMAALNTPPAQASAQIFLNVLRDGLAVDRSASELILPSVDLTQLFPERAAEYIVRRNGAVRLGCTVARIDIGSDGFLLTTKRGNRRHARVIVATQSARVPGLTSHLCQLSEPLRRIAALSHQSIVTVYLRYSQAFTLPFPLLGMSGDFGQWLFDRARINGQPGLLAVVISAYGREQRLSHAELVLRVHSEVVAMLPHLGAPEWSQVIEEKQATFACVPNVSRPDQCTRVPGLFLAGDYTASEYPATLEAAVRSGLRCADLVTAQAAA